MTRPARCGARGRWLAVCLLLAFVAVPGPPVFGAPETEPADASHLDVLLVADTGDEKIGRSVATDLSRMRMLMEMGVPEARMTLTVLDGASATPGAVRAHYKGRKARPHEARLFYYAGHGAWTPAGQALELAGGKMLPRSMLREIVTAGDPRLAVFLTDCCSTYIGMAAMARVLNPDPETFRDLLFRCRGVVDVTAAKRGQAAVGNGLDGGYFTTGILEALTGLYRRELDADRNKIVSWKELLDVVRGQTERVFDFYHAKGLRVAGRLQRNQTPTAFGELARSMGVPIPRSPQRLGVRVEEAGGRGVRLTEITPGSPAAWSGLKQGELLTALRWLDRRWQLHSVDVTTIASLQAGLEQIKGPQVINCLLHMPGDASDGKSPRVRDVIVHLSR